MAISALEPIHYQYTPLAVPTHSLGYAAVALTIMLTVYDVLLTWNFFPFNNGIEVQYFCATTHSDRGERGGTNTEAGQPSPGSTKPLS
ncbi:hypothetical protein V496_01835 [Pseudogymnoascus sp. VKM F-4515 (FW-2607)]|nr:hypothetical protein V496_01835 [Pseudogymnoascus sp. VKM F-4515 (FW-2607)]